MSVWLPSLALFGLACLTQIRVVEDPIWHMLIQMPLLALCGALVPFARRRLPKDAVGPVLILTLFVGAIWMLPRSLDAALISWGGHIAKFTTIPLLFGLPLAVIWRALGPVLRGFLKAQSISMLLLLAFLYTHAPLRICNSYLVNDQVRLGHGFLFVALGLVILWLFPIFTGPIKLETKGKFYEFPNFGK